MKFSGYALLILAILLISGCKYEEGPLLSLRSKTDRLTGQWFTEKVLINDEEWEPGANGSIFYKFEEDGTYRKVFENGTWQFDDNKENILLYPSFGDEYQVQILRLTNKELWLELMQNGKLYEYFLVKEES